MIIIRSSLGSMVKFYLNATYNKRCTTNTQKTCRKKLRMCYSSALHQHFFFWRVKHIDIKTALYRTSYIVELPLCMNCAINKLALPYKYFFKVYWRVLIFLQRVWELHSAKQVLQLTLHNHFTNNSLPDPTLTKQTAVLYTLTQSNTFMTAQTRFMSTHSIKSPEHHFYTPLFNS